MPIVLASTDQVPGLDEFLTERQALGLDRYDEFHDGVYVIVTGPTPEHGKLIVQLILALSPAATSRQLDISTPANIGVDKVDCRVPDLAVFQADTERTSPAFLSTAELVIEVLSPGETPLAKLDFYARWNITEYAELDQATQTIRLFRRSDATWHPTLTSAVLGFDAETLATEITWP